MTDCVTRTGDDKTMWLVTLPEIITNNSTRQEENLVVILSREESWGPTSDHFPDGLYRVSCIMTLYLADTELTKTQTFTAIYWPQQKALHLFTDEFRRHCCKVSDEAAFCLIQRPYISKTLLTRRISPRGSP